MKLKEILMGRPIANSSISEYLNRRVSRFLAFSMYSSGVVSSVIYSVEAILFVIISSNPALRLYTGPVALAVGLAFIAACLLSFVIFHAYPSGGICFTVVNDSLPHPVITSFASVSMLLVYVFTLAITVSAAALCFVSIFPGFSHVCLLIEVLIILVLMYLNNRGGIASNVLLASVYIFVVSMFVMLLAGFTISSRDMADIAAVSQADHKSFTCIFRAFMYGFAALLCIMSVTESAETSGNAISPQAGLALTAITALVLFLGVTRLYMLTEAVPAGNKLLFSQVMAALAGRSVFWYVCVISAALLLLSSGNTCFRNFPRLLAVMAKGGIAPRQLKNPGETMTYSNGIIMLALMAVAVVLLFRGRIFSLLTLYTVFQLAVCVLVLCSVAVGFYRRGQKLFGGLSAFGTALLAVMTCAFVFVSFRQGAAAALMLLCVFTVLSCVIKKHYATLADELRLGEDELEIPTAYKTTALILTSGIHRGVIPAISYAKSIASDTRALYIDADPDETDRIRQNWEKHSAGVPLVILESPYRSVVNPILRYVKEARRERPGYIINVIIPEIVFRRPFSKLLHNKLALVLRLILSFQKDVIVTHVSYYPKSESKGDRE